MKANAVHFGYLVLVTFLQQSMAWERPTQEQLDSITRQAKVLFEYDEAVQRAIALLRKNKVPTDEIALSFSQKTDAGREVVFGKLSPNQEAFLIVYRVFFPINGEAKLRSPAEPERDVDYYLSAAKSIGVALDHYRIQLRPYDYAILPEGEDKFNVYIYPAVVTPGVYPLGGDVLFVISRKDFSVLDAKQLHRSILEVDHSKPGENQQIAAGIHSVVTDTKPVITDVFHVLKRKPAIPEYVVISLENTAPEDAPLFIIEPDGSIRFKGLQKELMKE